MFGVKGCYGAEHGTAEARGDTTSGGDQGAPGTFASPVRRMAGAYPSVFHVLWFGTLTGKVQPRLRKHLRYRYHHRQAQERLQSSGAAQAHPARLFPPDSPLLLPHQLPSDTPLSFAPAAATCPQPNTQSPVRNAFSDSQRPSAVAQRDPGLRRTCQNFEHVLLRCRSRQVFHNTPQPNTQVPFLQPKTEGPSLPFLRSVKILDKVLNRDTWSRHRHSAFYSSNLQLSCNGSKLTFRSAQPRDAVKGEPQLNGHPSVPPRRASTASPALSPRPHAGDRRRRNFSEPPGEVAPTLATPQSGTEPAPTHREPSGPTPPAAGRTAPAAPLREHPRAPTHPPAPLLPCGGQVREGARRWQLPASERPSCRAVPWRRLWCRGSARCWGAGSWLPGSTPCGPPGRESGGSAPAPRAAGGNAGRILLGGCGATLPEQKPAWRSGRNRGSDLPPPVSSSARVRAASSRMHWRQQQRRQPEHIWGNAEASPHAAPRVGDGPGKKSRAQLAQSAAATAPSLPPPPQTRPPAADIRRGVSPRQLEWRVLPMALPSAGLGDGCSRPPRRALAAPVLLCCRCSRRRASPHLRWQGGGGRRAVSGARGAEGVGP